MPVKEERGYLQVLQDLLEQWEQPEEEALSRLDPPPMPNPDQSFFRSGDPQAGQQVSVSRPGRTRASKVSPQARQAYS